jgi:hypothetical protein
MRRTRGPAKIFLFAHAIVEIFTTRPPRPAGHDFTVFTNSQAENVASMTRQRDFSGRNAFCIGISAQSCEIGQSTAALASASCERGHAARNGMMTMFYKARLHSGRRRATAQSGAIAGRDRRKTSRPV